jgi:hypothetical protein
VRRVIIGRLSEYILLKVVRLGNRAAGWLSYSISYYFVPVPVQVPLRRRERRGIVNIGFYTTYRCPLLLVDNQLYHPLLVELAMSTGP